MTTPNSTTEAVTEAEVLRFQNIQRLAGTEDALDDLLQSRASAQGGERVETDPALRNPGPWRVGLFWSSSSPTTKVRCLAEGATQIAEYEKRADFIQWLATPPATSGMKESQVGDAERDPMIEPAVRLLSIARWAAGKIDVERRRGAGYRHAEVDELLRADAAMREWLVANGWQGDIKTAPTVEEIAAIRAGRKG